MTKEQKGILAVLKVQQRAVEKGVLVSAPINPCRYDLILDDGTLNRVQVKYGGTKSGHSVGAVRVDLRRHGKTYSKDEIDAIVVYLPAIEKICWFGSEVFDGREAIYVRYEPSKNNQRKKCILAEKHFW
jgi:PD-(D/E)XK endonuclease